MLVLIRWKSITHSMYIFNSMYVPVHGCPVYVSHPVGVPPSVSNPVCVPPRECSHPVCVPTPRVFPPGVCCHPACVPGPYVSHPLCVPTRECPTPCVFPPRVCSNPPCVSPRVCSRPVSIPLLIYSQPVSVLPRVCSHRVCPTPCVMLHVCSNPSVSHSECVPLGMCPTICVSHSVWPDWSSFPPQPSESRAIQSYHGSGWWACLRLIYPSVLMNLQSSCLEQVKRLCGCRWGCPALYINQIGELWGQQPQVNFSISSIRLLSLNNCTVS